MLWQNNGVNKMDKVITDSREGLQDYIERLLKEYNDLVERHGHGVRAAHVSTELGILAHRISMAKERLA